MHMKFVKTKYMIRKSIYRILVGLLIMSINLILPLNLFAKVVCFYWASIHFISLFTFNFSGLYFEINGMLCFRRRFKKYYFPPSAIRGIHLADLKTWQKYGFYTSSIIAPGFTFPYLTFSMLDGDGKSCEHKVFVNTFKEDGKELQFFLDKLQELNPFYKFPNIEEFNSNFK